MVKQWIFLMCFFFLLFAQKSKTLKPPRRIYWTELTPLHTLLTGCTPNKSGFKINLNISLNPNMRAQKSRLSVLLSLKVKLRECVFVCVSPVKQTGHLKVPPMPSKLCSIRWQSSLAGESNIWLHSLHSWLMPSSANRRQTRMCRPD